jgi:predicted RNase H-like HicB family nuclease
MGPSQSVLLETASIVPRGSVQQCCEPERPTTRILKSRSFAAARLPSPFGQENSMRLFTAVIERCSDTGLYVGYVPGFPGAHSQGTTLDELHDNLREVIAMLMEDGDPKLESEFIGTQTLQVS